jgi:hypothetical protein
LIVGTALFRSVPFVAGLLPSLDSAFCLLYRSLEGLGQRILFSRYKAVFLAASPPFALSGYFFLRLFYEDAARVFDLQEVSVLLVLL